jgi:hypothetical protein
MDTDRDIVANRDTDADKDTDIDWDPDIDRDTGTDRDTDTNTDRDTNNHRHTDHGHGQLYCTTYEIIKSIERVKFSKILENCILSADVIIQF